mgnify:CR=1 FL=1
MASLTCHLYIYLLNADGQRTFIAIAKAKGLKDCTIIQQFRNQFPECDKVPNRKTIRRIFEKLTKFNTLSNLCKNRSGRKRSVRTQANIDAVRETLESEKQLDPSGIRSSSRRNNLEISRYLPSSWFLNTYNTLFKFFYSNVQYHLILRSSFLRIVNKDLHYRPYQLKRCQYFSPLDKQRRLRLGEYLITRPTQYFKNLIVTGTFHRLINNDIFVIPDSFRNMEFRKIRAGVI